MKLVMRRNQSVTLEISAPAPSPPNILSRVCSISFTKFCVEAQLDKKNPKAGQLGMSSLDTLLFEAELCQV